MNVRDVLLEKRLCNRLDLKAKISLFFDIPAV